MEIQCLLQSDGTTVLVVGTQDESLQDVVSAAHNEYKWLQETERAKIFAAHR